VVHFKAGMGWTLTSSSDLVSPFAQVRHLTFKDQRAGERWKLVKAARILPPLILSLSATGLTNTRPPRHPIYCTLKDPWTRTLAAIHYFTVFKRLQWLFF